MKTRDKNKNQYGSFAIVLSKFRNFKTTASLIILAVVFVLGLGIAGVKYFHKSKPITQSETKSTIAQMPSWWLMEYFGTNVCNNQSYCGPDADPDHDGLTNAQEYYYHTNPLNDHTVGDKLNDGQLVAAGFDPSKPGEVTFDQSASDTSIFGESLLFDSDVKQMVAQQQDISKVNIPLVADSSLKIDYSGTTQSYQTYVATLQTTTDKYFPSSDMDNIVNILKTDDGSALQDVETKSQLLVSDLKAMTVPEKFLDFHKDYIAVFQLLPDVVSGVPDPSSQTLSTDSDQWYAEAQAFLAADQKLQFQEQVLSKEFPSNP